MQILPVKMQARKVGLHDVPSKTEVLPVCVYMLQYSIHACRRGFYCSQASNASILPERQIVFLLLRLSWGRDTALLLAKRLELVQTALRAASLRRGKQMSLKGMIARICLSQSLILHGEVAQT